MAVGEVDPDPHTAKPHDDIEAQVGEAEEIPILEDMLFPKV